MRLGLYCKVKVRYQVSQRNYPRLKDHSSLYIKTVKLANIIDLRDEWPSGLNSFRQVTEVKFGRVRSNSGWVISEA